MKRKAPQYSNLIYGFDIETSTIVDTDGVKKSFMYIGQFGVLDTNTGKIENAGVIRNWTQFDEWLENIDMYHNLQGTTAIIYVHNNYEWNFIQYNSKFFINSIVNGKYEAIFKASTKPLSIRISHIELRDSLLLLNKSIKNLGDEFKIPKLEYDYDVVRYPTDKLTELDYKYNWRDVEIALTAIYDLYKREPYIKSVNDIPLTQTGRTRKNNETDERIIYNNYTDSNMCQLWYAKCRREFPKDMHELELELNCSKGGYVHANGFYVGKDCINVHSFDLSSAHPSQTLNRVFPAELPAIADDPVEKYNELIAQIIHTYDISHKYTSQTMPEYLLSNPSFTKTGYHGTFVLHNVRCIFHGTNYMPTISISKCRNVLNPVIDNGRIIKADAIELEIDYISMMQYMLTYEYEVADVLELWFYKVSPAHTFTKQCVKVYAAEKTSYKKCRNYVRDNHKLITRELMEEYECTDKIVIEYICSIKDVYFQLEELEKYLLLAKQKLNAQYGINMQNPINEDFKPYIEDDTLKWESELPDWETVKSGSHKNNYLFGMYMPIYTQLVITCASVLMYQINPDSHILYWDTDSMKVDGDLDKCKLVVDKINKAWTRGAMLINKELYEGLGLLDYEETYDHFSSIGCKRYIALEGDHIHATISGMTRASEVYQRIYNQCHDFNTILHTAFRINTEFVADATEGLASYYGQCGKIIDKLGDGTKSGVVLDKAPFYMNKIVGDTKSMELNKYYHLVLEKVFHNKIDTRKNTITRNKKGEYLCNRRIIK